MRGFGIAFLCGIIITYLQLQSILVNFGIECRVCGKLSNNRTFFFR